MEAFLVRLNAINDQRIRPVHMKGGRRLRSLVESISELTESDIPDWSQHFEGPRACLEYLQAVEGAGGFTSFENDWSRQSGVALESSAYHEHRSLMETLRLAVEVDQLAACNLRSVENVVRRLTQIEVAVERNPQHPDFTGLSELVGSSTTVSGGASVRKFREWISTRKRDRAQILNQARLERDERKHIVPPKVSTSIPRRKRKRRRGSRICFRPPSPRLVYGEDCFGLSTCTSRPAFDACL